MIHPNEIVIEARKKEDENYRFRSFLKRYADEEELDIIQNISLAIFCRKMAAVNWEIASRMAVRSILIQTNRSD